VYDKNVLSPYQRLLASTEVDGKIKAELTKRYKQYNPVLLQQEVHKALDALMALNKTKDLELAESLTASAIQAT